jgi:hypothetical protein
MHRVHKFRTSLSKTRFTIRTQSLDYVLKKNPLLDIVKKHPMHYNPMSPLASAQKQPRQPISYNEYITALKINCS